MVEGRRCRDIRACPEPRCGFPARRLRVKQRDEPPKRGGINGGRAGTIPSRRHIPTSPDAARAQDPHPPNDQAALRRAAFSFSGTESPGSGHHRRPPCCVGWPGGQGGSCLCVHGVRLLRRPLVRQVPRLLLFRDARRGSGRPGGEVEDAAEAAAAARRRQRRGGTADLDRGAGARPRARRRARPGVARARRRRAGSRQVDATADGAGGDLRRAARAARHGRGVGGPGEAARGAARRRRAGRDPRGDRARRRVRDARDRTARRVRDRLGADALLGRPGLGSRLGRAGARGRGAAAAGCRRRTVSPPSSSAM